MKYFHGSSIGDISVLKPHVSNHGKSLVYITTNEVIAALYMVKTNWYSYGFKKDSSIPVYTEYYKDGLKDIYENKTGYIYECENTGFTDNPTNIKVALVSEKEVPIINCIKVDNVYDKLLQYEKEGKLVIQRYGSLNEKQLNNIGSMVINEINEFNLVNNFNEYSAFIKARFPEIWDRACSDQKKG